MATQRVWQCFIVLVFLLVASALGTATAVTVKNGNTPASMGAIKAVAPTENSAPLPAPSTTTTPSAPVGVGQATGTVSKVTSSWSTFVGFIVIMAVLGVVALGLNHKEKQRPRRK